MDSRRPNPGGRPRSMADVEREKALVQAAKSIPRNEGESVTVWIERLMAVVEEQSK